MNKKRIALKYSFVKLQTTKKKPLWEGHDLGRVANREQNLKSVKTQIILRDIKYSSSIVFKSPLYMMITALYTGVALYIA